MYQKYTHKKVLMKLILKAKSQKPKAPSTNSTTTELALRAYVSVEINTTSYQKRVIHIADGHVQVHAS